MDILYPLIFKISFYCFIISSLLVISHAILSAKSLGGTLGQALKKIATGTIVDIIIFITYLLLEGGNRGVLTNEQISLFFTIAGLLGSIFLFLGFLQLYQIAKKLKLFTV